MAADDEGSVNENVMERLVSRFREIYVEKHGEEPSEEIIQAARRKLLLTAAEKERDRNRDIYDELARE